MIKIIKQGTRHKKECQDCGCIFAYDDEDTEVGKMFDKGIYIKCPQCGKMIALCAERGINVNEIPIN